MQRKTARSRASCSVRVPGLQSKTKRVKPVLFYSWPLSQLDLQSIPIHHCQSPQCLPQVQGVWLAESSSASSLVRAVVKEMKRGGLPLLPLGAAVMLMLFCLALLVLPHSCVAAHRCSCVCTSSQAFSFWHGPWLPGLTWVPVLASDLLHHDRPPGWLVAWGWLWSLPPDLLLIRSRRLNFPTPCRRGSAPACIVVTLSSRPPHLPWWSSLPVLPPDTVPVVLQSSAFQMQKLLDMVNYIFMSAELGQERGFLSWRYFQNFKNTLSCRRHQNFQNTYFGDKSKVGNSSGLTTLLGDHGSWFSTSAWLVSSTKCLSANELY